MNNDDEVKRFEHAGRTIVIYYDRDPIDPCKDYDNFTKIVCWHRRADLGNETNHALAEMSEEEVREYLKARGETVLAILPVYLYQHSGMTMSTEPFSSRFDSGQVGWAFVSEPQARNMMGETDPIPAEEELKRYIREDVKTYDKYLTGEVYGFTVLGQEDDGNDGETLESCWGFFDLDDCIAEAKSTAEHSEDPAVQEAADELASRATYAGACE